MLSVIIKALNEEEKIASCIESVMRETSEIEHEIILVDSLSSDRTVEIGLGFPIRVVQFESAGDIGCGAAAQLGYQASSGDLIYLIDGDMEMVPGFLSAALRLLSSDRTVAGVGGVLIDQGSRTAAEIARKSHYARFTAVQEVASLGGGGLYRREAIECVGYFAHRGLKALEELELGLRLKCSGWRLVRLPVPSVSHKGHQESFAQAMARLWRSQRLAAHGSLIRSAWRTAWFFPALMHCWFVFAPGALLATSALTAWLLCSAMSPVVALPAGILLTMCFAVVSLAAYKNDLVQAVLSVCSWFVILAASIRGVRVSVGDPMVPVCFREL